MADENNQDKPPAPKKQLGGYRPGSGRKKGSTTKLTREIANRAIKEGITPLEVMLKTMRRLNEEADKAKGFDTAMELKLLSLAADIASKASPYMHPRMNPIEPEKPEEQSIENNKILIEFIKPKE